MTKSAFFLPVIIISLAFMMSGAGAQGMKIGIVDMNRVFAEYYKTKDADKVVNEQKEAAKKAKTKTNQLGYFSAEEHSKVMSYLTRDQTKV